jgi:hypothetical protein
LATSNVKGTSAARYRGLNFMGAFGLGAARVC